MPGGGTLIIEVSNAEIDSDYAEMHADLRPGRYALIAVTDTGGGMTPEVRERAFEPFFTTKPVGSGTGLGLSMVYGFVKQSGGDVQIYSELRKGTTVRMYLPRAEEAEARESRGADSSPGAYPGKGERILVVEDDRRVRGITVERLKQLGYRIVEAENGSEAVRLLGERGVDLLFTDMVMPGGMGGAEVAREARRLVPGLKVLFTTGYAEPEVIRAAEGGHWLRKPYTALQLARKLREMLDG
jgi:CheY-like chemotaxis protein